MEKNVKQQELKELFNKIFRSKLDSLEGEFDSNVFFLANNPQFLIATKKTPDSNNDDDDGKSVMFKILESVSANGKDLRKIKVKVDEFIDKLVMDLLDLQLRKEKINDKINSFNIDENLNIIEQKKNLLKGNYSSKDSKLRISIARLDNFPYGDYSFRLKFKKITKNQENNQNLIEAEEILYSLISQLKKESSESLEIKDKIKEFSFPSIIISPFKLKNSDYKNPDNVIIKEFSGTNINYFQLEIKDNQGNIYQTVNQEMIDLYFKIMNFLMDTTSSKKEFNLNLIAFKIKPKRDENELFSLAVNICIEIEPQVRRSILKRILKIYKDCVAYRSIIDNSMNNLISYFDFYKENILEILERKDDERSGCEACNCNIF